MKGIDKIKQLFMELFPDYNNRFHLVELHNFAEITVYISEDTRRCITYRFMILITRHNQTMFSIFGNNIKLEYLNIFEFDDYEIPIFLVSVI